MQILSDFENFRESRERYLKGFDDGTTRMARAERRQLPRWTAGNLPATVFLGSEEITVRIENLSLAGAGVFNAPIHLKDGDAVVLATCLGSHGPFLAQCTVIRPDASREEGEIGLRFEGLQQEDTNALFFFLYDRWQQKEAA
jgi:hypothetical protein